MKKATIILLTVIMILSIAAPAYASVTTHPILEGTNGTPFDISTLDAGTVLLIQTSELVELTGSSNILIICPVAATLELINVTISSPSGALQFTTGANTLTITGTSTLTSASTYAGIEVSSDVTSLTIDGTGTLNSTSGYKASAIGGCEGQDSGEIIINGGTINAYGSSSGIGGGYTLDGYGQNGYGGTSGDITINGGVIHAESSSSGAGIGGGNAPGSAYGHCNNITINGGIVTALSTHQGNGIGSGEGDILGTISITGGQVTATGGQYGAGIGGRKSSTSLISISGGLVIAEGGSGSAGIGGKSMSHGGDIEITGGEVYAKGATDTSNAYIEDIGCGDWSAISSLEISGNTAVFLWKNKTASLTTEHTNISSETVTNGSAYGFNNFPENWEGDIAYAYLIPVTVSFENCDEPDQNTYAPLCANQPSDPERSGSIFMGWKETTQYPNGELYDFDTELSEDITLYAIWETPSDVNEDDVVNMLDITACAQEYGSTAFEGREDVNSDGLVNLYDMVEIAGNMTTY